MPVNTSKYSRILTQQLLAAPLLGAAAILFSGCAHPSASSDSRPIASGISLPPKSSAAQPDEPEIESTEPWSFNSRSGRLIRTPHYRIFTTQSDTVLNSRMPLFVERALSAYRTSFTSNGNELPEPDIKLDTFVLATRPDWVLLTKQLTGDKADLYLRIPRGGFAFAGKALLYDIGARDTLSIVAHEGWHQYTQRTFKEPLPVWLEEGLATMMEGHKFDSRGEPRFLPWCNTERLEALRRAHAAGSTLALTDLLTTLPQNLFSSSSGDALVYYAQVWALSHFFLEGSQGKHKAALDALISDAANGKLGARLRLSYDQRAVMQAISSRQGPMVFEAYFGDLTQASEEYARFLDALTRTGAREAIVAGRSPIAQTVDSARSGTSPAPSPGR